MLQHRKQKSVCSVPCRRRNRLVCFLRDGLFGFYLGSEKGVTFPPSSSLCVPADPPSRNCDARADLAHYGMQRGDTSPSPACCGRFARICRRTMHFLFNR
ncbi:hypothetical protein NQZ68_020185 [Dissostichus eleginoides]|nr:hypothetical protein NQZ68_020185 [Dissostichus eleginoides]